MEYELVAKLMRPIVVDCRGCGVANLDVASGGDERRFGVGAGGVVSALALVLELLECWCGR